MGDDAMVGQIKPCLEKGCRGKRVYNRARCLKHEKIAQKVLYDRWYRTDKKRKKAKGIVPPFVNHKQWLWLNKKGSVDNSLDREFKTRGYRHTKSFGTFI